MRSIAGQNTLITRTIHEMEYNALRDEIVVPEIHADAIMTFRGGSDGDQPPVRVIHGPDTQLNNPIRLALDPIHKEIFVPETDAVLVFPSDAEGNVAPIRVLKGPDTLLGASAVAVDPVHNVLVVRSRPRDTDGDLATVLVFNRTDAGNVKPHGVIHGSKTRMYGDGVIRVYPPKEEMLLAIRGRGRSSVESFVGVWSNRDSGDVAPRWTIGGPNGELRQARGITLDPKSKTVIISDKFLNTVFTYSFPEIF